MTNTISFVVSGRYALFTDPLTHLGGEKFSYQVPTYEALKGIVKSIYWKPTIIWHINRVRILNPIQTQSKGFKPLAYKQAGNSLAIYTYLKDVAYQVEASFEWNMHRPELDNDRNFKKHFEVANRMLKKGGRQDIFLGTRECQGYVEPCEFGEGKSFFDDVSELSFGLMFHGFDYPDETGINFLRSRFWRPIMKNGVIEFIRPDQCETSLIKEVYPMKAKKFIPNRNFSGLMEEGLL